MAVIICTEIYAATSNETYEYLKMYIIAEVDDEARKRNVATMTAANALL